MIEMSKDNDYLEDGYNGSSRTSISTFPFGNDLTIERSPSDSLVSDTRLLTASSGPRHYHPDSESPSHPDLVQPAAPYYPPFDNLLGLLSTAPLTWTLHCPWTSMIANPTNRNFLYTQRRRIHHSGQILMTLPPSMA